MRIVHLSTSDLGGGAARAAYRLHCGLRQQGHESRMLVLRKVSGDRDVRAVQLDRSLMARIRRRFRHRAIERDNALARAMLRPEVELFSDDRTDYGRETLAQIGDCDIVSLHWVAGLLDHESFFAGSRWPMVWRLADMAAVTGGCHYDQGCGRFAGQCGRCPQLNSTDENDFSRQIWTRKKESFDKARTRLHIVGTSRWIAAEAKRSSLLGGFPISVIPNGLDVEEFAPRDKRFSRDLWGIDRDARVVLFAAESIANRRKGLIELVQALNQLADVPRLLLVSVGSGKIDIEKSIPHMPLGRISNDRALSTIYSAADVFVIPSLQESFGQTVIESLACGTPVAGFATGGIVDMVRPGQTGWLAPTGDVEALAGVLRDALLNDDARRALGENARRIAVEEYSLDVQARAYAALYESLLTSPAGRKRAGVAMAV